MSWYDTFSGFYDRSLEKTYAPFRTRSFERLGLQPGGAVLDLACGTGQNLPYLAPKVGAEGSVLAVDLSEGMLARAGARAEARGWSQVRTIARDVGELTHAELAAAGANVSGLDAVVCTLGLTVVPNWQAVLRASFELLRPGGEYLIMDVFARRWNPMKPLVELLARADVTRDVAGELESLCVDFAHEAFSDASPWTFGGELFVAHGRRAG